MKSLSGWRDEIDVVDRELVQLLNRRAANVLGLAPLKRDLSKPIHEPQREQLVHENIHDANQGPLSDESLDRIYEVVLVEMRAMQKRQDK